MGPRGQGWVAGLFAGVTATTGSVAMTLAGCGVLHLPFLAFWRGAGRARADFDPVGRLTHPAFLLPWYP